MSDNIATSPAEGLTPVPAALSEPAGGAPVFEAAPIAPQAPAPGTPAPAAIVSKADLAFAALQADPRADDNQPPVTAPTPPAAPAPPAVAPVIPTPPPVSDPLAAPEHEEPEPTAAETQAGNVPLKKLLRALDVRRQAKNETAAAKADAAAGWATTDKVLKAFSANGIDAANLPAVLANLERARNDPAAQANLLAALGIQLPKAAPQAPSVDLAAVRARLAEYDTEGAMALLGAAPAAAPVAAPAPPVYQAPPVQPVQPPQNTPPADPAQSAFQQTVSTMGAVLRDTYGETEAARLYPLIDAEANARVADMRALKVAVSFDTAAEVWRKAQSTVLRQEAAQRTQPAPSIPAPRAPSLRPVLPAPPRKLSADEKFSQLQTHGL